MAGPVPCLNSASEIEEDYEGRGYATSRLVLPLGHSQAETLRNCSETNQVLLTETSKWSMTVLFALFMTMQAWNGDMHAFILTSSQLCRHSMHSHTVTLR